MPSNPKTPSISIPIIELPAGSGRNIGRAYGEAARESIHTILNKYRRLLDLKTGLPWEKVISSMQPFLKCTQESVPELVEEIEGIAEGANLPFVDVFALNCRSEILFQDCKVDECTSIATIKDGSQNTILAQNWDWYASIVDCQVIIKIPECDGKPSIITFTEAGQLAKIGMNGAGIGLAVNNLSPHSGRVGIPWIFIARKVLESHNFTQALGTVLSSKKGHSMNYLLASAEGLAGDIESSPKGDSLFWPNDNYLCHTNHYLQPRSGITDLKLSDDQSPSTFVRWWRANCLLKEKSGNHNINTVKAILKDHCDHPFSICWHSNDKLNPELQHVTCLSIIMEIDKFLIHFTKGNPCCNNYKTLDGKLFLKRQKEEDV